MHLEKNMINDKIKLYTDYTEIVNNLPPEIE